MVLFQWFIQKGRGGRYCRQNGQKNILIQKNKFFEEAMVEVKRRLCPAVFFVLFEICYNKINYGNQANPVACFELERNSGTAFG